MSLKVAKRLVLLSRSCHVFLTFLGFYFNHQVTPLQIDHDALTKARATSEENHRKEVSNAQGRIDAANQHHRSELASRKLALILVESNLERALASTQGALSLETCRLEAATVESSVLLRRNAELVAQVSRLQQLVDQAMKESPPPIIPPSSAIRGLTSFSRLDEASIPQPGPNRIRLGQDSRTLSTGIKICGAASERIAQRQSSVAYEQVRQYAIAFYCSEIFLLTSGRSRRLETCH